MQKDSKQFLFFDDLSNMKIVEIPLNKSREYKKPVSEGDAYYIKDSDLFKIKTAKI